jgi:hypothetical protein
MIGRLEEAIMHMGKAGNSNFFISNNGLDFQGGL